VIAPFGCFSLYLFKKTEWREEHDAELLENKLQKKYREWSEMEEKDRRAMMGWMVADQVIFPVLGLLYIIAIFSAAAAFGCTPYGTETPERHSSGCMSKYLWLEIFLSVSSFIVICLAAFYDLWKSAEMSHAPHTPLKNRVKEIVAPKLGLKTKSRASVGSGELAYSTQQGSSGNFRHSGSWGHLRNLKAQGALGNVPAPLAGSANLPPAAAPPGITSAEPVPAIDVPGWSAPGPASSAGPVPDVPNPPTVLGELSAGSSLPAGASLAPVAPDEPITTA